MDGTIPLRRSTSFSLAFISSASDRLCASRRAFSFCAKAMYVERILEPYRLTISLDRLNSEFNDHLLDLLLFLALLPIDIPNLLAKIWTKAGTFV